MRTLFPDNLPPATRLQVFQIVWAKVRDTHWDPRFGGVNWNAVRARYAPKVKAARDDREFFQLLQQMVQELGQSHFNIIPPDVVVAAETNRRSGDGETGLTVSLVDGDAVVTRVEEYSPAQRAKLRPGLQVTAIDGTEIGPILARIRARRLKPTTEQLEVRQLTHALLSGPVGEASKVSWRGIDGERGETPVVRSEPKGRPATLGNLPPMPAFVESRRLENGVGYVRLNIFLIQPLMAQMREAILEMADTPALVIDLRGNPGGVGGMAAGIAGMLTARGNDRTALGTMKTRGGEIRFAINPQEPFYTKPVAVLVDEMSLSTSEILAGGLQEMRRATVVGRATGGMVLPSYIEKLPGGVRFQYAVADFKTPRGVLLEGRGVVPDIPVPLSRRLLWEKGDPILAAALDHLRKKANLT